MKLLKKALALGCVLAMAAAMFTGCDNGGGSSSTPKDEPPKEEEKDPDDETPKTISKIELKGTPTKTKYDLYIQNVPLMDLTGMSLEVYYDGEESTKTIALPNSSVTVKSSEPTVDGEKFKLNLTASYNGKESKTVEVEVEIAIIAQNNSATTDGTIIPLSMCGYTGTLETTNYYKDFSSPASIPVGSAVQTVFKVTKCGGDKLEQGEKVDNWFAPGFFIRKADDSDLCIFRSDNWVNLPEDSFPNSPFPEKKICGLDWDNYFDNFKNCTSYVTVVNNGTNIDLYYHLVKDSVVKAYQYYVDFDGTNDTVKFLLSGEHTDMEFCE